MIIAFLLAIATVSTAGRLYMRRFVTPGRWELDDYLIMVALVSLLYIRCLFQAVLITHCTLVSVMAHNNGFRFDLASADQLTLLLRVRNDRLLLSLDYICLTVRIYSDVVANQIFASGSL